MKQSSNWVKSGKTLPPRDTLIQFVVKVAGKYGEYWGQYDGVYRGYVSAEMPFPQDFTTVCAWKKTELSITDGKPSFQLAKKIKE